MPDFTRHSNFDKDANFGSVKFGADAPLLETELNELQDIQNYKRRELLRKMFDNCILELGNISYVNHNLVIENTSFLIDGELIYINNVNIPISLGQSFYIKLDEKVLTHLDDIKEFGNEHSNSTIPNNIVDSRVGAETSRRVVLTYSITTTPSEKSFKLGEISNNGELNITAYFKQFKHGLIVENGFLVFQYKEV